MDGRTADSNVVDEQELVFCRHQVGGSWLRVVCGAKSPCTFIVYYILRPENYAIEPPGAVGRFSHREP